MTRKLVTVPVGAKPKIVKALSGEVLRYESYGASVYVETMLDDLINTLKGYQKAYGKTYTDLRIQSKQDCGCYQDCSCSPTYYVAGTRLEDDVEYDYRLRYEANLAAQREERERREYEILKAKFEKN